MSLYVLDTDILTLYREQHETVQSKVKAPPGELAISVLTVDEQLSGWYTLARKAKNDAQTVLAYDRLASTVRFLATWPILPLSEAAIGIARRLRAVKPRIKIRTNDLYIAATTLEHNATLVSRNLKDFQRVPGLQVEDWSV
jgi:tRNA(fMet)-specific endonuclease VapC